MKFGKYLAIISLNYFFFLFILPHIWNSYCICVSLLDIVPQLCNFFLVFFLCFILDGFYSVSFVLVYCFSLIFSSAMSNLLLISFGIFFISDVVFFISLGIFYIFHFLPHIFVFSSVFLNLGSIMSLTSLSASFTICVVSGPVAVG